MTADYKIGDLVWAKLGKYPPWPSRIEKPKPDTKKPKNPNMLWVHFFGTHNYSWIITSNIKPYAEFKATYRNMSKTLSFEKAVNEIENYIKTERDNLGYDAEDEEAETTPKRRKRSTTPFRGETKRKRKSVSEENGFSPPKSNRLVTSSILDVSRTARPTLPELAFGFLGLGVMGTAIVKKLISTGHKVNIWNRNRRKAEDLKKEADIEYPGFVHSYKYPCDVVDNSDIIFCCVSGPVAVNDVINGEFGVLYRREFLEGKGYVEMSSVDNETALETCNIITSKGGRYLSAHLQGSKTEVQKGHLTILCAGDEILFIKCQTCFEAIGRNSLYMKNVGCATKMNLVLQVVKGVALAGLAEAFKLAKHLHLKQDDVLKVLELIDVVNPYLKDKAELIIQKKHDQLDQLLQHMQGDTRFALQLADLLKQPLLLTATANEIYKHARPFDSDNCTASGRFIH